MYNKSGNNRAPVLWMWDCPQAVEIPPRLHIVQLQEQWLLVLSKNSSRSNHQRQKNEFLVSNLTIITKYYIHKCRYAKSRCINPTMRNPIRSDFSQTKAAMSKLFHKGPMWLQVFFSTKQQHTRPDSFNQLVSVFRKLIGQTVCSWLVGTKTCSHTALCAIDWTCLD